MNREETLKVLRPYINDWESLDKEAFIFDQLIPLLTDKQLEQVLKDDHLVDLIVE